MAVSKLQPRHRCNHGITAHCAHKTPALAGMLLLHDALFVTTNAVSPAQSARSRKPVVDWVRSWTAGQVQGWLRANGLAHLAAAFANIAGKVRRVHHRCD